METEQYPNSLGPDDDDDESHFVQNITGSATHHDHETDPSNYAHPAFARQNLSIDPALQQVHGGHYAQHQFPRQLYSELAHTVQLQTPAEPHPTSSPTRFASDSPSSNAPKHPSYVPTDRTLPDKQVTDETLDDAYCAFIFYCNPSVPLDCDTTDLRKAFRQPPMSDKKRFNTYRLLQLIGKLEAGEIKTWTNLAEQLGVEKKENSSTQKLQQYAVRLKRWMHAMHIDAFFEYVLGKHHNYYQQIPAPGNGSTPGSPERDRDGVPVEEDLALRALHPETRPKRGRRKTDDKDDGSEKDMPATKRPNLEVPTPNTADPPSAIDHFGQMFHDPHSAVPHSAHPDSMDRFMDHTVTQDQWSAAAQSVVTSGGNNSAITPTTGQQFRWRAYEKADSVNTPQTATRPSPSIANAHVNPQDTTVQDEPVTPSIATPISAKSRARRRHGPAVSSAWPSSGNPTTGKLRGRPPSNRSVRDGPFSTFPANPTAKGHTIDLSQNNTPASTPIITQAPQYNFRPQQLHLTVPQRTGGNPIAMASPASAVNTQINGGAWRDKTPTIREPSPAALALDEVERRFVVALLQAPQENMNIGVEEAKRIAEKSMTDLRRFYTENSNLAYGALEERIALLTGTENGEQGFRNLILTKLPSELEELGLHDPDDENETHVNDRRRREQRYEVRWQTGFGTLQGVFTQKIILPPDQQDEDEYNGLAGFPGSHTGIEGDDGGNENSIDGLRRKVLELEALVRVRDEEVKSIQSNILKAVLR